MKKTKAEIIIMWIFFAIFIIYAISLIFPFIWVLLNSFKSKTEFFHNMWGFPEVFTIEKWRDSFKVTSQGLTILDMFGNSLIFTIVNTFLHVMSCSCAAYIMSKYPFKGRELLMSFLLVVMMIPTTGSISSVYRFYNDSGLINTYLGIFIMNCGGFGVNFLLLYGFYKNLSWTYAEAAEIDGASHFQTYLRVMLPMAIPAITAVSILAGIGQWNDYFTIYMYAPEHATLAVGTQIISNNTQSTMDYPQLFAIIIFTIIPVLIVYAAFQKTIMKNTAIGGIKG